MKSFHPVGILVEELEQISFAVKTSLSHLSLLLVEFYDFFGIL